MTDLEQKILDACRHNEMDENIFDGGAIWTETVIDESGIDPKIARGVISSLVKKNIIIVSGSGRDSVITLRKGK